MATISSRSLSIEQFPRDTTKVTVTVKYTLVPNAVEKLAGSVFSENIQLIGDDPGIATDSVRIVFPAAVFAVSATTPTVERVRTLLVLKSALNEDPGFERTGAEQEDEILAKMTWSYAACAPTVPALPGIIVTNTVRGAWK